jgi:beta-phosphoglucomutase-like phosphatase (HAD superfamily)
MSELNELDVLLAIRDVAVGELSLDGLNEQVMLRSARPGSAHAASRTGSARRLGGKAGIVHRSSYYVFASTGRSRKPDSDVFLRCAQVLPVS